MKDNFFLRIKFILFVWLILSSSAQLNAQINPKKLPFEKICAGAFNEFSASFIYSGFPATTTFVVELSDNLGSFTNPVSTTTLSRVDVSSSEMTIKFAIPVTLIGSEIYSLRIKSSTGVTSGSFVNSLLKTSFPVYYKPFEGSFYINNQTQNVIACNGGSVKLSIDNLTPSNLSSSPANYPNIKYKWYKDGNLIPGETGIAVEVSTIGTYYAEIDYGACTDVNFRSQSVTASVATGALASITSSLGNSLCSSGELTTLSTQTGNSYIWKKDNIVIQGVNTNTYQTNQPGLYTVDVNFGGCMSTASIDLKAVEITSSINVSTTSTIIDGQTITVIATTDAVNPIFQWYQNNILTGVTGNTFDVSAQGDYKVVIRQTSGCDVSNEIPFILKVIDNVNKIPNIISLSSSYPFNVWDIPNEYKNPKTHVLIISSSGEIILDTNDYQSNWPTSGALNFKDINPVFYYVITSGSIEKKGSITLIK